MTLQAIKRSVQCKVLISGRKCFISGPVDNAYRRIERLSHPIIQLSDEKYRQICRLELQDRKGNNLEWNINVI